MDTPIAPTAFSSRKLLLIISTKFLKGNEVLVGFSDGSSAIYDAEELEKLRPAPKHTMPAQPAKEVA